MSLYTDSPILRPAAVAAGVVGATIPEYADLTEMGSAIIAGDLAECDVALVTADGKYYAVVGGTARDVCTAGAPYGLTQNQFDDPDLQLAIRADDDMLVRFDSDSFGYTDVSEPPGTTWADNEQIWRIIDASPKQRWLGQNSTSAGPRYDTEGAYTQAIQFAGGDTVSDFIAGGSSRTNAWEFLQDDTTDFTLQVIAAIDEPLANGPGIFFSTRFGADPGIIFGYDVGGNDLAYGVGDPFTSVGLTSWSGFVEGQVYEIVVAHTQGGSTELRIDGSVVATNTITTWNSNNTDTRLFFGADAGLRTSVASYLGATIHSRSLTDDEISGFANWIRQPQ